MFWRKTQPQDPSKDGAGANPAPALPTTDFDAASSRVLQDARQKLVEEGMRSVLEQTRKGVVSVESLEESAAHALLIKKGLEQAAEATRSAMTGADKTLCAADSLVHELGNSIDELTPEQQARIDAILNRFNKKT